MKYHLATDSPEFQRAYALAAELRVPMLIHFQEVDHFPNEGTWSTGFAKNFERMLKTNPRTTFIGHADARSRLPGAMPSRCSRSRFEPRAGFGYPGGEGE